MSTDFLLVKAAEKDQRILELELRLHEVVQREQTLLKQLNVLYIEKNKEREDKQILQCRVDSLEAELSVYTNGSGLTYVAQEEANLLSQGVLTDHLGLASTTGNTSCSEDVDMYPYLRSYDYNQHCTCSKEDDELSDDE